MSVYASGLMAKAKRECQKNFKLHGVYETNFQRHKRLKNKFHCHLFDLMLVIYSYLFKETIDIN